METQDLAVWAPWVDRCVVEFDERRTGIPIELELLHLGEHTLGIWLLRETGEILHMEVAGGV